MPLIGVLVVLALGVAMLLSALYPRFRDVRPIWEVVLQIIFYGSPILYAIEVIPNETLPAPDHAQPDRLDARGVAPLR